MPDLMNISMNDSQEQFEMKARCNLGCGVVFLFGENLVTATMKQIFAYTRWYIKQAQEDGKKAGLNIGLGNFSNSVMEGVHKRSKQVLIVLH